MWRGSSASRFGYFDLRLCDAAGSRVGVNIRRMRCTPAYPAVCRYGLVATARGTHVTTLTPVAISRLPALDERLPIKDAVRHDAERRPRSRAMADEQRTGGGRTTFGDELRSVVTRAEEELNRLIRTVNDEVVPDVRRQGSSVLRSASERLREMAESLDKRTP